MKKFYVINYDNGDMRAGYFNSGMEVLEYAMILIMLALSTICYLIGYSVGLGIL